ncbi:HepT-like ribonuclease domain-containing protein [Caulobacter vibrioides]|uniref:HepT-like ribonuclease domain-containing protein n=1 Tax=Caulobacter vibrioides TaxID=155892 RepID=UPI000BB5042A|nr:HepT-like ribonuclease domain-containing protein [Caulobacter vibrioides]ATC26065.1 DUF86 domain-containing protein [Caulobacter vibrioides]PLR16812.1 DUF86 domain-containing protein [Caulobacter vibrioides]
MGSPAQAWSSHTEREALDALRTRYESEGFAFIAEPRADQLPDFMAGYRPDAVAHKPGQNVAIEIKHRQSPATERRLQDTRRIFDGQTEWRFHVFFSGDSQPRSVAIPVASEEAILDRGDSLRSLASAGYRQAAFVMAWSLLEAALLRVDENAGDKPRTPGTVLQILTMNGHISGDTERRLRKLIDLRNRIVHGDVEAEPTADDVQAILAAIKEILSQEAA